MESQHALRVVVFAPDGGVPGNGRVMGGVEVTEKVVAALDAAGLVAMVEWQEIKPVRFTPGVGA